MRTLLLAASVVLVAAGCSLTADRKEYRVPSPGMEPTIHCAKPAPGCRSSADDRVVVDTSPGELRRGDIIAFKTPPAALQMCGSTGVYVKRVVGMPGETVREQEGGSILVDGRRLPERYVGKAVRDDGVIGTWHVRQTQYFVLGDNRAYSCDSRRWGGVPQKNVIGRVIEIQHKG
jgi:signal peptidase I